MVSVVLARYRSFGTSADFSNTVESVVLSLREAQVYGAGGKKAVVLGSDCEGSSFNCAYGVHFITSASSYTVFVDKDSDGMYDSGEEIQTIILPSGVAVALNQNPLDIVFKRPFPDAQINNGLDDAQITLSKSGSSAIVSITSAGQISVQ